MSDRVALATVAAERAQATRGSALDDKRRNSDVGVEPAARGRLLALHNTKLYAKDTAGPDSKAKEAAAAAAALPAVEVRRTDSFSGKLLSLFRPTPAVSAPNVGAAVISLPTSHQFSSTSGDEEEMSPVRGGSPTPDGGDSQQGEVRSFLDAMLQWREPAPAPPQTLALLGSEVVGEKIAVVRVEICNGLKATHTTQRVAATLMLSLLSRARPSWALPLAA